jgi:hypothetical protein
MSSHAYFPKGPHEKKEFNFLLFFTLIFAMLIFFVFLMTACHQFEYLYDYYDIEDDNLIEEGFEYIIEKETGVDIDITPRSSE